MFMKRRQILGAAGAIAGTTLAGCGGGDGDLADDSSSEIGAYTGPTALVPQNGQYQVEVMFNTKKKVKVTMGSNKLGDIFITSKGVSDHLTHKLGLGMFRCTSTTGYTRSDFWIRVDESNNVSGVMDETYYAGKKRTTTKGNVVYETFSTHVEEYEWRFYSRYDARDPLDTTTDKGDLIVTVRFMPLQPEFYVTFQTGEYIRRIENTATHVDGSSGRSLVELHSTALSHGGESLVTHAPSTNKDSIHIPFRSSQYAIVPSYLAASTEEKPLLRRLFARHMSRVGAMVRAGRRLETAEDVEVINALSNELLRLHGGKSLVDAMANLRNSVRTWAENEFENQDAEGLIPFLEEQLAGIPASEMSEATRKLHEDHDQSVIRTWVQNHAAVTAAASTSIQVGSSLVWANFPPGVSPGLGGRISLGITRHAVTYNHNSRATRSVYKWGERSEKGYRLGFVAIGKLFSEGPVSQDIELSFNVSVMDGKWRLDNIVADYVMDFDTTTFLGNLLSVAYQKVSAEVMDRLGVAPITSAVSLPAIPNSMLTVLGTVGGPLMTLATGMVGRSAGYLIKGLKSCLLPVVKAISRLLGFSHTWATLEGSPLRFIWTNGDVNDPDIPFRAGYRHANFLFSPAVKVIGGKGIRIKSPEVEGPAFTGFVRAVTVGEVSFCLGSNIAIRQVAPVWGH